MSRTIGTMRSRRRTPDRTRLPGAPGLVFTLVAALTAATAAPSIAQQTTETGDETASIDAEVLEVFEEKGSADVWIVLEDRADLSAAAEVSDWADRGEAVVDTLQEHAEQSQAEAVALLTESAAEFTPYWISNRILVRSASESLANSITQVPGVERVALPSVLEIPEPLEKTEADAVVDAIEWGIGSINADDVWADHGVTGEGIVVGSIDTGAEFDHPALIDAYRGNLGNGGFDHDHNWFDPSNACGSPSVAPCDNNGHGSHVTGTMTGDDGAGNQIGVAPGAQWISAKGCESTGCSDSSLLASGQWILAPTDTDGQNPRADLRPHVVNNSWGSSNGSIIDPWYDEIVGAWTASGIFGLFSNGNSGPGCNTTGSPADSALSYGVGAYDVNNDIAYFSSRGPGADGDIRPSISAPGVNVRSSVPGGGYSSYNGTSMAAPHVAGAVALLWSAAPSLVGDIDGTRALLDTTAIDVDDTTCGGTAEDNNVWGEGRLDIAAAVDAAPRGDTGILAGTVTDTATGEPVSGAQIAVSGPQERAATADEDGTFSLTLAVGDYAVTGSAFGYGSADGSAAVLAGETATVDLALTAVPTRTVFGQVADSAGTGLSGIDVAFDGGVLAPVTTDANGGFTFDAVPEGTYELSAGGSGCVGDQSRELVVAGGNTVANFSLPDITDTHGNFCRTEGDAFVAGDTPVSLTGDDAQTTVALPFPVGFYGQQYDQAYVSTNGFLSFTAPATSYLNGALPSSAAPNGAVYPFWDDLTVDSSSGVFTGLSGDEGEREFVIEWRNVRILASQARITFSVAFQEAGGLTFNYAELPSGVPAALGSSATVGIENASGTDALQYSFNSAVLAEGTSIRFDEPDAGFLTGTVVDANDGLPVGGASVAVSQRGSVLNTVTTADDGTFVAQQLLGYYTVSVGKEDYSEFTTTAYLGENRETVTVDAELTTARGEASPGDVSWIVPQDATRSTSVTLSNTGDHDLSWAISERGGDRVNQTPAQAELLAEVRSEADRSAVDTRANYTEEEIADLAGAAPLAEGEVLASWDVDEVDTAWGVGVNESVWISDPVSITNTEFATDGSATGRTFDADWAGTWNADLAYDSRNGLLCQVNVGGDNGIHCWDEADGSVGYSITGSPWSDTSQRGLAYRADDDSFYIGGWNEGVIYHVAGSSHSEPGSLLASCTAPETGVAGLAYHPVAGTLWVTTNSPTDTIYQIDPATCAVISTVAFPETVQFAGAGAELDADGALWVTSQVSNTAYLIDSGVPVSTDVPWLKQKVTTGSLEPGDSIDVEVEIDTSGLESGVYQATLLFDTNAGRQPVVQVPVEVVVSGYWQGVSAGGVEEHVAADEIAFAPDQAYTEGSWGWIGEDSVTDAVGDNVEIVNTREDALYRSQRSDLEAYRFDDLPAGTYEVTLGFAELKRSPKVDWRKFDVTLNDQVALLGYDIAQTVGGRAADQRVYTVTIDEGESLDIEFLNRRSYQPAAINNVEVVHRPDW
ncbi:S8 family serine peptidase [Actinoalloteichus hymeniacidonis]|uniref:Subtilase family protease n=1 Tax=Actinoalloteichus hymeniacidonis TaxID=340345 RepID=A0AAC9HPD9_9PSEU|nr:S8 family serine peptidase [Actinoalloteichus hymeniacidonis]AOS62934.1 subtilase family protease [Actinoalloteichus hymeniacidonis]MBB5909032.1 subtilisin family serine protease [Actinoalloteichus hymeniacidonis]